MWKCVTVAGLGLVLASCAGPRGIQGNDTGGIIPWTPQNELRALPLAQEQCDRYNKGARLKSNDRGPGGYIVYECGFDGPLRRQWR